MRNSQDTFEFVEVIRPRSFDDQLVLTHTLLNSVSEWIVVSDKDYNIIYMNSAAKKEYGEGVGKKCYSIYQKLNKPCHLSGMSCTHHQILDKKKKEYSYISKDLKGRWLEIHGTLLKDRDKEYIIEVVKEITEKKKLEIQLKTYSENLKSKIQERTNTMTTTSRQFKDLFNLMPDPSVIVDSRGKFLAINEQVEKVSGFTRNDLLGKNFLKTKIVTSKSKAILIKNLARRFRGEKIKPYEIDVLTKDGDKLRVELNAKQVSYQGKPASMVVFRNITERNKIQSDLQASEERLKILFEYAPDAYYLNDLKGNFIDGNRAAEKLIGYKKEEAIGKSLFKLNILSKKQGLKAFSLLTKNVLGKPTGPDEFTLTRKDGSQVEVEIRTYPIKIKNKTFVLGMARDISQRKKMQETILQTEKYAIKKESEEKFKLISENTSDLIAITTFSRNPKYTYVSPSHKKLLGFEVNDLVGKAGFDFIHPEDKRKLYPLLLKYLKEKTTQIFLKKAKETSEHIEFRSRDKSGKWHYLESTVNLVKNQVLFISRDIIERKQMEEKLKEYTQLLETKVEERTKEIKESEERLRILFEYAPDAYFLSNLKGVLIDANKTAEEFLGYTKEKVIGKNLLKMNLLTHNQYQVVSKLLPKLVLKQSVGPIEVNFKKKNDSLSIAEVRLYPVKIKGKVNVLCLARDITERKKNEEALKKSIQQFENLFNLNPDPTVIVDAKGTFLAINDKVETRTGFTKKDLIGKNFLKTKIITAKSKAILTKKFTQRMLGISESQPYEVEVVTKEGEHGWAEVKAATIEYEGKKAVMVVFRETTERKLAEKALQESEEKYRTLVKTSPDAVTVTDLQGTITYISARTLKLHGYTNEKELLGKNALELIAPDSRKEALSNLQKTLQEELIENVEYPMVRKDGSEFIGELNAALINDATGKPKGFIATTRDVTERYKVMELKDRFVAAATHELRTPLVSIKAYLELIKEGELGSIPKEMTSGLNVIERNAEHLMKLTSDLLDIRRLESDKLHLDFKIITIQQLLNQCINELQPIFKEKNQMLNFKMPNKPLEIKADEIRINQIILNLLSNASKFTPNNGQITILIKEKKNLIHVIISDSGIGIKNEDLERVFEPFASIKKPSYIKGTGLGLSVSKRLVEAHGGEIWAESPGEGNGTTVTFTLPKITKMIPITIRK